MFRTDDSEMAGVPGMFGEGLAHWHSVSRVLRTHWYHATVLLIQPGRTSEIQLMINDEHRLQAALISQDETVVIKDVQVVTPAYMNKGEGWKMEPLTSVKVGTDEDECFVCIITVDSGAVYHSSHRKAFDRSRLNNLNEIFNSNRLVRS